MRLPFLFVQELSSRTYSEKFNQIPIDELPEDLFAEAVNAYSSITGKTPLYCPFTVVAESGYLTRISRAQVFKNREGKLGINWGPPDHWLSLTIDQLEFAVVEDLEGNPSPTLYIKGFEEIKFPVRRVDITKNSYYAKGITENIAPLKSAPRHKKMSELDDGEYLVKSITSEFAFGKNRAIVELEDGVTVLANTDVQRAADSGILTPGAKIIKLGDYKTSKGYAAAKVAILAVSPE